MGCTSSSERALSIRVSRSASRRASAASKGMGITDSTSSTKLNDEEPGMITSDEFEPENTRMSKFKANDRASLAAALEEYEGSNHTASTRSADSAVICIVRSDKLAFSGHGIRRHSRRKRRRHNGNDNTRIIVLRKPSRRDTTMLKVDERIPMQECPLKNLEKEKKSKTKNSRGSGSSDSNSYKARHPKTPRNQKYYSKKLLSSPIRTPSILSNRKSSGEISDIMMIEDQTSRDQILKMSVSSRELFKNKSVNALQ